MQNISTLDLIKEQDDLELELEQDALELILSAAPSIVKCRARLAAVTAELARRAAWTNKEQ